MSLFRSPDPRRASPPGKPNVAPHAGKPALPPSRLGPRAARRCQTEATGIRGVVRGIGRGAVDTLRDARAFRAATTLSLQRALHAKVVSENVLRRRVYLRLGLFFILLALVIAATSLFGQGVAPAPPENPPPSLTIGLNGLSQPPDVDVAIKLLFILTLLTLAPSILLLMTCFTRIVIVLSFVRSALSLQGAPANQILIGLSLFLTFFIMQPVWERIDVEALQPYRAHEINSQEALARATVPIKAFMLKQARPKDVELFVALARIGPTPPEELPLKVVIPGFIISELRTAFQMGFLLFVPFILIDLVVATVLMSMGMFMMPPMLVSLPLKILLFVLVDGWNLVVTSVVRSFGG
jgi:flagellar biosynthetic protein FliP